MCGGSTDKKSLKIYKILMCVPPLRESKQFMLWGFDYLISRGSVTLTNSSSNLNFAPRCEERGIQFRVHFEIHDE